MIMKKYILIQIALLIAAFSANSQTLTIVRTDIDTARANFVTATQMFGIDIVIDSLKTYNRIIFDLQLSNINQFKFSNYIPTFPNNVATIVYPDTNSTANTGSIFVGIFFQDYVDTSTTPRSIIHLDFVVNQNATNGETISFSFENQAGIKIVNGEEVTVKLNAKQVDYTIHSFVDVWPGDANNDGVVDQNDFVQIGKFYGNGNNSKQMRSYVRQNASTIWKAQRALAWDVAEYTFADCDGNGDINLIDMLVVYPNHKKTHSGIIKKVNEPQSQILNKSIEFKDTYKSLPIYFTYQQPFQAALIKLKWDNINQIIPVGFIKGDVFEFFNNDLSFYNINEDENSAEYLIGYCDNNANVIKDGTLAYFIYESNNSNIESQIEIESITGINSNGNLFPIQSKILSSIDEIDTNNEQISLNVVGDELMVNFSQNEINEINLSIYDVLGNLVKEEKNITTFNIEQSINISNLPTGYYYARVIVNERVTSVPFIKE